MRLLSTLLVLLVALLVSCSSITVNYDYDAEYVFTAYKTFKWGKMNIPNDALRSNPMAAKRVDSAIRTVMEEKAYKLIEDENVEPDFFIVTHAGIKERMQVHNTGYAGYNYGWYQPWWGPYGGYTSVSHYEEGTLVIDIVDMKNKELVWRGLGTKIIANNTGEKQMQVLEDVVRRIMANFPPPGK